MDKIVVLDFGSQYSHLICRRLREINVYCEILPYNIPLSGLKSIHPKGIILSGGPASIYSEKSPKPDSKIFDAGIPILGICYGHQLIVDHFGGKIKRTDRREYGRADLIIDNKQDLFSNIDNEMIKCWMSHGDAAEVLPEELKILAHTPSSPSAAVGNNQKGFYGLQFHPEVVHTEKGVEILKNFSQIISKARPEWSMESFIEMSIANIRKVVGKEERVLCAVSGGIDSTTVAALINKAIGDKLQCVFVNHGLLRKNEEQIVTDLFKSMGIKVIYVNADKQFLEKLKGVQDPEKKRLIIGEEFANVFIKVAEKNGPFHWLAQGTLYPDVIESGVSKGPAAIIKTHHNVGGLPKWLNLKVIEPLNMLYKDEVRKTARLLGVPHDLLIRHPFPGPGLAVRIIGEVTPEKLRISKHASEIVETELQKADLYDKIWQAFAIVGDDRAVGVIGDERIYGHIVTIRVVDSTDAMTADWTRLPPELIERISNRITNEVENVAWVSYAVSSKPPATIEPQ
jgi:GMP synthase (glutamine-hydrolysing)